MKKINIVSALIWIISGLLMIAYALWGVFDGDIPGIEELILFLEKLEKKEGYIYLVAFLIMVVEGLYLIGNIFPGSTMILILVVASKLQGVETFFLTFFIIYLGWILAGLVNILFGIGIHKYFNEEGEEVPEIKHNSWYYAWITWFPAFRSAHEVASMVEGHSRRDVFMESLKVKAYTIFTGMFLLFWMSGFLINANIENKEGFTILVIIGFTSIYFGNSKLKMLQEMRIER